MSTSPGIDASGRQITLRGVNFRPDDEIHSFAGDEPEPDKVVSRQYVSATQVNITLPMYMLPHKFIELYIVAQYSGGPMKGPTYKLLGQSPNKKQPANKDDSMPTG